MNSTRVSMSLYTHKPLRTRQFISFQEIFHTILMTEEVAFGLSIFIFAYLTLSQFRLNVSIIPDIMACNVSSLIKNKYGLSSLPYLIGKQLPSTPSVHVP